MVSFFITTVLWQMRGIREEDNSDRPNVLVSLLLRKSQTVPVIYFGKYQNLVNWNTRWSTCSPSQKGKLRAEVCLREASQIIIYGGRKFVHVMWFVKVFIPCFNPYGKHLGADHHVVIVEKRKTVLFLTKAHGFSPIGRVDLWTLCWANSLSFLLQPRKQTWVQSSNKGIPDQLK